MLRKTPLRAKTPLKSKTPLRSRTPLRAKTPLRAVSPKAVKPKDEQDRPKKRRRTEPNYVADMDAVFQFYVRLRDAMPGGMCRCISCGNIVPFEKIQGGHYRSRMHMATRWNEDNCHGECMSCNLQLRNGDHLIDYRKNLIRKIGNAKVEWLDTAYKQQRKWSDFEIKVLIKQYGRKVMDLSVRKGIHISQKVYDIIVRYQRMPL